MGRKNSVDGMRNHNGTVGLHYFARDIKFLEVEQAKTIATAAN